MIHLTHYPTVIISLRDLLVVLSFDNWPVGEPQANVWVTACYATNDAVPVMVKVRVHADITTWKRFSHYGPVVKEIIRYFPHKESVMWSIHTWDKNGYLCLESVHFMKLLENISGTIRCSWFGISIYLLHTKQWFRWYILQHPVVFMQILK